MCKTVTFYEDKILYWEHEGWIVEIIEDEEFDYIESCTVEEVMRIIEDHWQDINKEYNV